MEKPRMKLSLAIVIAVAISAIKPALAEEIVTEPVRCFKMGYFFAHAISPSGLHWASCGEDGAYLRDFEAGSVIRTFSGHTWGVFCVCFSPDETRLATG